MATNTQIQRSGGRDRLLLRLTLGAAAIALGGYAYGASSTASRPTAESSHVALTAAKRTRPYSYGWPIKPFDKQHPVRGNFGDPRMIFAGPPTTSTLFHGSGAFSFHQGIDISAPNGTAVYPVESGRVTIVTSEWVQVESGGGRAFQYWHITPAVVRGQQVDEDATVLGHILRPAGHVHLTQLIGNQPVNPLAPENIGPYEDTTVPRVTAIAFRQTDTGRDLMPELLRGRVQLLASALDFPSMPAPGEWHGLPITPARITWRIQRAVTGRVVVPEHVAWDVRASLPGSDFWRLYARGTHQNMCVFGTHYSYMQPGVYLFKLAPEGFDTRRLTDDVYDLVVTASDIAGNQSSSTQRFSVHNRPGWVGP